MATTRYMAPEIWSATDIIFVILDCFFALLPPNDRENQKFFKNEKMPVHIIILHIYTINGNHMMHGF